MRAAGTAALLLLRRGRLALCAVHHQVLLQDRAVTAGTRAGRQGRGDGPASGVHGRYHEAAAARADQAGAGEAGHRVPLVRAVRGAGRDFDHDSLALQARSASLARSEDGQGRSDPKDTRDDRPRDSSRPQTALLSQDVCARYQTVDRMHARATGQAGGAAQGSRRRRAPRTGEEGEGGRAKHSTRGAVERSRCWDRLAAAVCRPQSTQVDVKSTPKHRREADRSWREGSLAARSSAVGQGSRL
jgi:hypothetical protein